ncbi:MAG TPA: hypothetical protein VI643_06905 [Planctomycetota bacterium]|nr:hypothetical protein [Planctomycetota bacterium]
MLKNRNFKFVRPDRRLRELKLLGAIEADSKCSQRSLGRETSLTAAMVNQYILEFAADRRIEVDGDTNRSLRYRLTEMGRRQRDKLQGEYLEELSMVHAAIREEYRSFLQRLVSEDLKRAAVLGANEKAELVCDLAPSAGMEIVGVYTDEPSVDVDIVLDCRFEGVKPIPRPPARRMDEAA